MSGFGDRMRTMFRGVFHRRPEMPVSPVVGEDAATAAKVFEARSSFRTDAGSGMAGLFDMPMTWSVLFLGEGQGPSSRLTPKRGPGDDQPKSGSGSGGSKVDGIVDMSGGSDEAGSKGMAMAAVDVNAGVTMNSAPCVHSAIQLPIIGFEIAVPAFSPVGVR